jgi:hypothetical protein
VLDQWIIDDFDCPQIELEQLRLEAGCSHQPSLGLSHAEKAKPDSAISLAN